MNTLACSRYSSTMLIAVTGLMNFLFFENMQKIPRTINFISTPALAASYNLKISSSSESEFIFNMIDARLLFFADLISLSIILSNSFLNKIGQGISVLQDFRIEDPSFHFSR